MTKQELQGNKYHAHMKAHEEYNLLVAKLDEPQSDAQLEEIKFSLEKLAVTLEEYFKVIGVP